MKARETVADEGDYTEAGEVKGTGILGVPDN